MRTLTRVQPPDLRLPSTPACREYRASCLRRQTSPAERWTWPHQRAGTWFEVRERPHVMRTRRPRPRTRSARGEVRRTKLHARPLRLRERPRDSQGEHGYAHSVNVTLSSRSCDRLASIDMLLCGREAAAGGMLELSFKMLCGHCSADARPRILRLGSWMSSGL